MEVDHTQERQNMLKLLNKVTKPKNATSKHTSTQQDPQRAPNQSKLRYRIQKRRPSGNSRESKSSRKFTALHRKYDNLKRKTPQIKSLFPARRLPANKRGRTPIVALDAEMLICTDNSKQIGRLSIVNYNRVVLYDSFFKPPRRVKNYLTRYSGLTFLNTSRAPAFADEKDTIEKILANAVIVGHSLGSDQQALGLEWSGKRQRDVSLFPGFKRGNKKTSLKELTEKFLEIEIQNGEHSSVEDARAALELYKMYQKEIDGFSRDLYFRSQRKAVAAGKQSFKGK